MKPSVIKKPRVYADACIKRGQFYYDYQNCVSLWWGECSNYACDRKLGRGKYSEVFEGVNVLNSEKCVVKILKPIKSKKINRQIKILQALAGRNNTIKLFDIIKEDEICCLVFQHVETIEYRQLLPKLTDYDCRYYTYQILKGLDYCHSLGIMHRDIKPQNVMIDHNLKKVRIIDWGLGEFYLPEKDYNVRVSSRYYKGPQLLIGHEFYHYSLDIWSLGVMLAGMIFQKEPFFKGSDNYDQLEQITKTLGTEQLMNYVEKYDADLDIAYDSVLGKNKKRPWKSYITNENKHLATPEALDILQRMVVYDHDRRPTAKECMQHVYFQEVHKKEQQRKPQV